MLYSILIYDCEAEVEASTRREDAEVTARHAAVQQALSAEGRLGPVARLMPTTAATTVRSGSALAVLDGPCAETRQALLGFYVVDCASLEEAIAAARRLPRGTFEIRPISCFNPGVKEMKS